MVRLFRPQIVSLIDARDKAIEVWKERYPDRNVFEDNDLEITSALDIDIDTQVAAVSAALAERHGS